MEIKRELEVTVVSNRRYVIRRSRADIAEASCAECGEPMVAVDEAATLLGVNQRRVFQIIESGAVHFTETDDGTAMICIASMASGGNDQAIMRIPPE